MQFSPAILALVLLLAGSTVASPDGGARLHTLFAEDWEYRLEHDPMLATSVGDHRADDRLPSVTRAELDRWAEHNRLMLSRLPGIDRTKLSAVDRVSYDVFKWELDNAIEQHQRRLWRCTLTGDSGYHTDFAQLPTQVPLATVRDYENYIARLRDFPRYNREQMALLAEGVATGFTLPRVVLEGYDDSIRAHVVDDPTTSVFAKPFAEFPVAIPDGERERLRTAGLSAIREAIVPAYRELLDFWMTRYLTAARVTTGASDLPDGKAYYAYCVRRFTTLDVTPEDVHRTGLAEVARIRNEMDAVIRQTGFKGDYAAFLEFLRTDPRFRPKSGDDLMREAAYIVKRMDGTLPQLFGKLPRVPYGIRPVPADLAPKYTAGRYAEPAADGSRAGFYWVNTYRPETRTMYTLEALSLHEAVPGHHLQIALQREQTDIPPFRRQISIDAYSEGWALYAERLGLEAGFYTDPYSNFGRLTYEMWRACRLVVDTGLHNEGWTRQQAMDYLAANTALSLHEVQTETDRYISWPGQALAYKTGELKIRTLRARAEKELGTKFDIRSFHDAILETGPVPLSILDDQVTAYTRARAIQQR